MKVKLSKAVKLFFGNSSLEMVYFEAIANALDANATQININIEAKDYSQPETLVINISDNGEGFTDERYTKFGNLFDVEDASHKGLGRLVYLCYFEKIKITSKYKDTYQREFEFSDSFDETQCLITQHDKGENGSTLSMSGYTLAKLGKNDYISPKYIKDRILEKFYSRLYKCKNKAENIEISISANISGRHQEETLKMSDIPEFTQVQIQDKLDLFSNIELYYNIQSTNSNSKVITAISVDDRTYPIDIMADENFPPFYEMVFLLYSDYFVGKVDASRESLSIPNADMDNIQSLLRKNIESIINEKIPKIAQVNKERKERLINRYPHLNGYFENDKIGYASQDELLKKAQDTFFRKQREILNANHLTDEQYAQSLDLASRTLTEYILFRQNVIEKLRNIDAKDRESVIHNILVPMKNVFEKQTFADDIYRNNIWVLDDKYMTYDTILSDKEMSDVVNVITEGEVFDNDDDRPDIALIFSGDPKEGNDKKVNVVIVELKKKGLSVENNSIVEIQLEKRARKLLQYYKDKIQQIWFYGIVEITDEYELHLASDYHKLYSTGKVYYRDKEVVLQANPKISVPIGMFIMDFDAVVNDADARNSTFLNIIRNKF